MPADVCGPNGSIPEHPKKEKKEKKDKKEKKEKTSRVKRGTMASHEHASLVQVPERTDLGMGFGSCAMCGAKPCLNRGCGETNRIICDRCWPIYYRNGCSRSSVCSKESGDSFGDVTSSYISKASSTISNTSDNLSVSSDILKKDLRLKMERSLRHTVQTHSSSRDEASRKDALLKSGGSIRSESPPVPNVKRQHKHRSSVAGLPRTRTPVLPRYPGFQHNASVGTWMMPLPRALKQTGGACSSTDAGQVSSRARTASKGSISSNKENIAVVDAEDANENSATQAFSTKRVIKELTRDTTISDLELEFDKQVSEAMAALADMEAKADTAAARVSSFDHHGHMEQILAEDTDGKLSPKYEAKACSTTPDCIIELGTADSIRMTERAESCKTASAASSSHRPDDVSRQPNKECVTDIDMETSDLCPMDKLSRQLSRRENDAERLLGEVNEKALTAAARVNELEGCKKGFLPHWMVKELAEEHEQDKKKWSQEAIASEARNSEVLAQSVVHLKKELAVHQRGGETVACQLVEMQKKEQQARERIAMLEEKMRQREHELETSMRQADGLIRRLQQAQNKREADLESMRVSLEESTNREVENANFYGCVNGGSASSFFSGSWFGSFFGNCRSFTA